MNVADDLDKYDSTFSIVWPAVTGTSKVVMCHSGGRLSEKMGDSLDALLNRPAAMAFFNEAIIHL